ncbi:MAG: hypothetical protein ACP5D1_11595 [Bacteroidales bacterium]
MSYPRFHISRRFFFSATVLVVLMLCGSCSLYNDYNLEGEYRLVGGEYYDGRMFPLETFEGTLDLGTTSYEVEYSLSFTKKDDTVITESRSESGDYNYTTEYETAVFGTEGKVFSGYIFFTPPEENSETWSMKYEYYKRDNTLYLDNYRSFPELGYYVVLRWEKTD